MRTILAGILSVLILPLLSPCASPAQSIKPARVTSSRALPATQQPFIYFKDEFVKFAAGQVGHTKLVYSTAGSALQVEDYCDYLDVIYHTKKVGKYRTFVAFHFTGEGYNIQCALQATWNWKVRGSPVAYMMAEVTGYTATASRMGWRPLQSLLHPIEQTRR